MNNPIDVVAILRAQPGNAEALAAVLSACVEPSKAEAGCLSYVLHVDRNDQNRFIFIERWADEEALNLHEQTPHFLELVEKTGGLLAQDPEIVRACVIA